MLLIDTNILYYICGLSIPPVEVELILNEMDTAESVVIPDVAFIEFLTKYRHHVGTIRKVCSFMRQRHIEIQSHGYYHLDAQMAKTLRKIRQKDFFKYFNPLFAKKVDVESRFATVVFFIVLICESVFECDIDPYQVPVPIYTFFSTLFKEILQPLLVSTFNSIYSDAYKTDDAENYIRHSFYNLLTVILSMCIPLCKQVVEACEEEDEAAVDITKIIQDFSIEEHNAASKIFQSKILKQDTATKFVQKRGILYGKKINDKHLNALLEGLNVSLGKKILLDPLKEYIYKIVKNIISNGGSFRKNDINDALILSNLKSADVVLSFDGGIVSHLQENAEDHPEYQNSLNLINSIKIRN